MEPVADRVRAHTARAVLQRIDAATEASLTLHGSAGPEAISHRLQALDREWDTDRVVGVEAAGTGLIGLVLGALVRPQLLAVPAAVALALLLHARTGRYPLMALYRRLGLRTAREIERERYALKALRGDFVELGSAEPAAAGRGEPARRGREV